MSLLIVSSDLAVDIPNISKMEIFDPSKEYSNEVLAASALIDVSYGETNQELEEYADSVADILSIPDGERNEFTDDLTSLLESGENPEKIESLADLVGRTINVIGENLLGPLVVNMPRSENPDREDYKDRE